MHVGICNINLVVFNSASLKQKRQVVQSLTAKIRNNFNVAIAEENNDSWKDVSLTIVSVNNEVPYLSSTLSKIVDFLKRDLRVSVSDYNIEIL